MSAENKDLDKDFKTRTECTVLDGDCRKAATNFVSSLFWVEGNLLQVRTAAVTDCVMFSFVTDADVSAGWLKSISAKSLAPRSCALLYSHILHPLYFLLASPVLSD